MAIAQQMAASLAEASTQRCCKVSHLPLRVPANFLHDPYSGVDQTLQLAGLKGDQLHQMTPPQSKQINDNCQQLSGRMLLASACALFLHLPGKTTGLLRMSLQLPQWSQMLLPTDIVCPIPLSLTFPSSQTFPPDCSISFTTSRWSMRTASCTQAVTLCH